MPKQIQSSEEFRKMLPKAHELRVVRSSEYVKLKLRMPDLLYTYKTNVDEADDLIKSAKDIEVVEFNPIDEKKKSSESKEKEAEGEKTKEKSQPTAKRRKSK